MDPMESECNAIVKQELIIEDDLELHDYEHLLQEFYYDEPADETQYDTVDGVSEFQVNVEDPEEAVAYGQHIQPEYGFIAPPVIEVVDPRPVEDSGRSRLTSIPMQRDEYGLFNCAECGKSYEKENSYFWHVRRHLNKKNERFYCQPCARSFTTKYYLLKHYTKIHGLTFDASTQMVVEVESNQVPLASANGQPQSFPEELGPQESDSFDLLLETFDEEVANPSSVIVKEEYVFGEGNEANGYETSLVDVLYSSAKISPAMPPKKSSRFKEPVRVRPDYAQRCPVCKCWYHTEAGLVGHLQRQHGVQGNDLADAKVKTDLSCARCDGHFASPQQLKRHKKQHAKIDSGRFKCTHCSKTLGSNQALKAHEIRKHRTIPSRNGQKSEINLIDPPKQDFKELKIKTQCMQQPPAFGHRKGRPKGSRRCPVCKQWYLTQEELRVHFAVHNQSGKNVATKTEYEQDCPSRVEATQIDDKFVPELENPLEVKSEPIVNERRKAGRPKGSRNVSSLLKLESEPNLHERKPCLRQLRKRVSIQPEMKSEPTLHDRTELNDIKPEPFPLERRKVGRPKGSRNDIRLNVIKEEPLAHVRRKVGRPKKSGNGAKLMGLKQERFGQTRRKVGRPNKKSLAYCARCVKQFASYASFKAHKIRHQNVDLRRFWCNPCEKGFASMNEKIAHEQRGHKHKSGRPGKVQPLESTPSKPPNEQDDETPTRRKAGRPRKHPQRASIADNECKRKVGRPQECRKCPLCKIWVRSVAMFKEHVRKHIQG